MQVYLQNGYDDKRIRLYTFCNPLFWGPSFYILHNSNHHFATATAMTVKAPVRTCDGRLDSLASLGPAPINNLINATNFSATKLHQTDPSETLPHTWTAL